ncbi:MAG: putative metalloprotease [Saprospiraceae bacterium]|jgi:predicted metalloprotease
MKRTSARSSNIEDRRGQRRVKKGFSGGGLGTIILIFAALFFGFNPLSFLGGGEQQQESAPTSQQDIAAGEFVSQVLQQTEDVWAKIFGDIGQRYREPTLVLFSGATTSACGHAQAAMGPFYCPGDQKVYIDTVFYNELSQKFGAKGDFAQAYVVAHEVAHHVQTLLGLSERVNSMKAQSGKSKANELSVRFELQADCLSGVWAHNTHKQTQTLEQGDIEEALRAAAAIGDDAIQRKTQGYVVPDSFTHGTGKQRAYWFMEGFRAGQVNSCDTFSNNI